MIDKINSKFKDNPSYDIILNEIKNKEDIKVKSDNEFTSLYIEEKESTKEITEYQVLLKEDNSIVLNTLFAIINNKEKSIVNSSLIEEYNSYGVMIKKEYKLYNTKTIDKEISDSETLKVSKESIDINTDTYDNYDYIEKLERHFFDTGYLFIRDKVNNKTYKSEVLLDDQKGLQKMYPIINNYRKQEINPITKEEIENKLNKETNDKVKENLKQMSQGREKYSYKSEYDKEYISQGYKNNTKKIVSLSIVAFVLLISIIYALFTQNLNTKGTGINRKSNFDIYFNNVSDFQTSGTASVVTPNPKIREHTTIIEDYEATLITPSDSIYFTFDIVNDGDYDATLTSLTLGPVKCSVNGNENDQSARNVCENIEYTMKYIDNNQNVSLDDTLKSKETKSVKVTLTYKDTISADKLPKSNVSIFNLGIELVYEADQAAKTNKDGSTPYVEPIYTIGEELTVKNEKYNVIGIGSDYLTLLKQEPLTVAEVNTYGGLGTEDNHVNKNAIRTQGTASNHNGYGGMVYYSSETCGSPTVGESEVTTGCESEGATNYANSDIKYVVDAWALDKFTSTDLKEVEGYKARLVQKEELRSQFYPSCSESATSCYKESTTPRWLYNSKCYYWTMSSYNSFSLVYSVGRDGILSYYYSVNDSYGTVRPVINLYKSALQS